MLDVALLNESGWPEDQDWKRLAIQAVQAAFAQTPHDELRRKPVAVEISVKLTNDSEVQGLNKAYRDKDAPTNVLSFPMVPHDLIETLTNSDDGEVLLGDIVLARETCAREAEEKGIAFADHATHLIIHGALHLLGYDHMIEHEAEEMEAMEVRALTSLGISDPYAGSTGGLKTQMAEEGPSSSKEADSSGEGSIWRGIKALLFGNDVDHSLRRELEDTIDEYDEETGEYRASPRNGDLTLLERQMLRNMLHFSEHTVDDIAVPRSDMVAIEESASFDELVALFAEAGHSRIPVYRETLDTIVGMIHIRDAFAILASTEPPPKTLESLIREPLYVPESMGVLDLLVEMRAKRTHLAIVLDEYSGTEGMLTFEDLVEEIVGEVEDEHDDEPEEVLVALDDGIWEADARAELEDVAEAVDARLADVNEDVDTLGGLSFVIAGHVPQEGEIVTHEPSGWRLEIIAADPRRVKRLRLHPPQKAEEPVE